MRDILIAGGGPAGLAAAIRAAQMGLDCAIAEPQQPPIDKACGEGLMPGALELLEALGVDALDGRPFCGIRYVDAHNPARSAEGDFARPGLGVRRVELHQKMWRRVREMGIDHLDRRVGEVNQRADHVEAGGVRARYLIAADGLHSKIRRHLGVEQPTRHAPRFGVRRHVRCQPWCDRVEVHWSARGEAYVTPVGPQTVGVAFLAAGGGRFDGFLDHFPLLAERVDGAPFVTEARGGGPFAKRVQRRVVGRTLLVGDAAGYLDPLTGEGVALAAATATAAVEAIAAGRPARYEAAYRQITREYYLLTSLLLAVSRRRWLHAPMIAALARLPRVFDAALWLLGGGAKRAPCR